MLTLGSHRNRNELTRLTPFPFHIKFSFHTNKSSTVMSLPSATALSNSSRPRRVKQNSSMNNDMLHSNASNFSSSTCNGKEWVTRSALPKSTSTEINEIRTIAHKLYKIKRRLLLELPADNKAAAVLIGSRVKPQSLVLRDPSHEEAIPSRVLEPLVPLATIKSPLSRKVSSSPNVALDIDPTAYHVRRAQAA